MVEFSWSSSKIPRSPVAPPPPSQRVLAPFTTREWDRKPNSAADSDTGRPAGSSRFAPPSLDVAAPDLYIPLMAFITYVLACGLLKVGRSAAASAPRPRAGPLPPASGGVAGHAAEVLSRGARQRNVCRSGYVHYRSRCSALWAVRDVDRGMQHCEAHPLRPLAQPEHVTPPSLRLLPQVDLVSLAGYKYVSMVVCAAVGLFLGSRAYYAVSACPTSYDLPSARRWPLAALHPTFRPSQALLYTGVAMAYFVVNSLMPLIRAAGELAGGAAASQSRSPIVLAVGAAQLLFMWWIGLALEA